MFWFLVIALGAAWALQSYLSFRQTKAFAALFVALRRRGRVCIGKYRGGLAQGSIVMFLLDEDGRVVEGHRLNGVTVLARFRELTDFDGLPMDALDARGAARHGKSVVRAVDNAGSNYRIISSGGHAPEPPTAVGRLMNRLPGPRRADKGRAASDAITAAGQAGHLTGSQPPETAQAANTAAPSHPATRSPAHPRGPAGAASARARRRSVPVATPAG